MALTVREFIRFISGRKWNSRILAETEHGNHRFEVIAVEGRFDSDVVLRLKTILPEVVEDREGNKWGLQSDVTFVVCHEDEEGNLVVPLGTSFTGYSLADIEREFGLKR